MANQFEAQTQEQEPVIVQPTPWDVPPPSPPHLMYGGIGLVTIWAVTRLIRELRLLADTLGK